MATYRRERMSELLRSFLATELTRMLDPRLKLITITEIDVAPDLRSAKVFWSLFTPDTSATGSEEPTAAPSKADPRVKEGQTALEGVKGQLKRKIGQELELRYVPELMFRFDASAVVGSRIDYLLDRVRTPES